MIDAKRRLIEVVPVPMIQVSRNIRTPARRGWGFVERHFYWNFAMTRAFGASRAAAFANSHEVSNPNPAGELAMDLHNNAVGRAMALDPRFRDLNAAGAAELAFRRGCLRTTD